MYGSKGLKGDWWKESLSRHPKRSGSSNNPSKALWCTWYYPLSSRDMELMSSHQRPPFSFKKIKIKIKIQKKKGWKGIFTLGPTKTLPIYFFFTYLFFQFSLSFPFSFFFFFLIKQFFFNALFQICLFYRPSFIDFFKNPITSMFVKVQK